LQPKANQLETMGGLCIVPSHILVHLTDLEISC